MQSLGPTDVPVKHRGWAVGSLRPTASTSPARSTSTFPRPNGPRGSSSAGSPTKPWLPEVPRTPLTPAFSCPPPDAGWMTPDDRPQVERSTFRRSVSTASDPSGPPVRPRLFPPRAPPCIPDARKAAGALGLLDRPRASLPLTLGAGFAAPVRRQGGRRSRDSGTPHGSQAAR